MKTSYGKKILGGLILGLSLAGIFVMSSATAQAQYRRDHRYEQDRYRRDRDRDRNRRDDWWNRNRRNGNDG